MIYGILNVCACALFTAVVSVDCLTVLLKDIKPLGILLGIEEGMMEAIQDYYANDEQALINRHIINLWLLSCSQDPIRQLRDALYELKKFKISQQLVLLTSLGRVSHRFSGAINSRTRL